MLGEMPYFNGFRQAREEKRSASRLLNHSIPKRQALSSAAHPLTIVSWSGPKAQYLCL